MQTKRRTRNFVPQAPGSADTIYSMMAALILSALVFFTPAPAQAQLFAESDLVLAIRSGELEQVEEQFLAGVNANERSQRGEPALIEAVRVGSRQIVALMLERGARVNASAKRDGLTALEESVRLDHPDIARMLIDAGADVDKTGKDGQTPLMLAAKLGRTNIVQLLIEADAYLNDTDATGRTPLTLAEERRHKATVELLMAAGAE